MEIVVKAKKGYKQQKTKSNVGRWLKKYFEMKTCRRLKSIKEYIYITRWSEEDKCYITTTPKFPSLSTFGDTIVAAELEFDKVLDVTLKWIEEETKNAE